MKTNRFQRSLLLFGAFVALFGALLDASVAAGRPVAARGFAGRFAGRPGLSFRRVGPGEPRSAWNGGGWHGDRWRRPVVVIGAVPLGYSIFDASPDDEIWNNTIGFPDAPPFVPRQMVCHSPIGNCPVTQAADIGDGCACAGPEGPVAGSIDY